MTQQDGQPTQEIADLVSAPGELSFQARIGGREQEVWFRTESPVVAPADAALAACLLPAMTAGGTLSLGGGVSPRVLRNQREFQAIQSSWSVAWDLGNPPLREVEVVAPRRQPAGRIEGRVAAFFSGGVDSWSIVLENPEVTDLIFVRGADLRPGVAHQAELADAVEERLRSAAEQLGKPLHVVETNVRELSDPLLRWEAYFASPLVAIALMFESLFERVHLATDVDYELQLPIGCNWLVDQLWSTEALEVFDDGGRLSREQRLRRIVEHPVVQRTLRVCWQNPDGAYNCGRCRKCLLTMISLEAIGARERIATFPPELDLELVPDFETDQLLTVLLWEDLLDTTRAAGRTDLERAVETLVVKGKRAHGLPLSHRSRRRPAPARGSAADGGSLRRLDLQ